VLLGIATTVALGQPSLRSVGRTGRLVTIYLPAILGEPDVCNTLSVSQQKLLRVITRELTRASKRRRGESVVPEIFEGNITPGLRRRSNLTCPLLSPDGRYLGFNGNKKRKGCGYYLLSPRGWLHRAGYSPESIEAFLDDLVGLSAPLGLIPVGIDVRNREIYDLNRMQALADSGSGRGTLKDVILRIYTAPDYLERWNGFFGWNSIQASEREPAGQIQLLELLAARDVSQRALANGIGVDPSFLNKLLNGKKSWPAPLLQRAVEWLSATQPSDSAQWRRLAEPPDCTDSLRMALAYRAIGWSVVPQLAQEKKPTVRWKPFQEELPSGELIRSWYQQWPDAGVALICGSISGVLVVDVDGSEAHQVLLERLGGTLPPAPKALSGSGQPDRYHLFLQHPSLETKAKVTPWHPKLEFRGNGSIVILPPSQHRSGNRYQWASGASLNDLPLPELPSAIARALIPPPRVTTAAAANGDISSASASTRAFVSGQYSEGPRWNERLFVAACDLHGRAINLEIATPLLLAGAKPWNQGEYETALTTIRSAYSQPRSPGQY
jgi:hypothetical protein